jgi:peptidoglycan glycosyltransferase
MISALRRLSAAFLLAFAVIGIALGYWDVIQRDELDNRQDNPRRVFEEQSLHRGDILDRRGTLIVTSTLDSARGIYTRRYLYPEAASVTGYYSLQHGSGGIEGSLDQVLRGDTFLTPSQQAIDRLLHRPRAGGDVRLTISLPIQQAARAELTGHSGAIILMNAATGEILAMDSQPGYDPNTLDTAWDKLRQDPSAPLLNRSTQALYQPGSALQAVVLGEALNSGRVTLADTWDGGTSARLANASLPCASDGPLAANTFAGAFVGGCPGAFQALGVILGAAAVQSGFSDFGLGETTAFDLPVAISTVGSTLSPDEAGAAAVGQSRLTVTPLQMVMVGAAFANHGQIPAPRLVQAIRPPGGSWAPDPAQATPRGTISRASIDAINSLMRDTIVSGAARSAYSPQRAMYGHVGLALAGPGDAFNTWFIGFTYDDQQTPIAIVVLLENSRDADAASKMGGSLLLQAAKLPK